MSDTRSTAEIVEAGIDGLPYLALFVSEVQTGAGELCERLAGRPGMDEAFLEALGAVASYEVRL